MRQIVDSFYKKHGWRFALKSEAQKWYELWDLVPVTEEDRPKYSVGYMVAQLPLNINREDAQDITNFYLEHEHHSWHRLTGKAMPMQKRRYERVRLAATGKKVITAWMDQRAAFHKEHRNHLVDPDPDGDSITDSQCYVAQLRRSFGSFGNDNLPTDENEEDKDTSDPKDTDYPLVDLTQDSGQLNGNSDNDTSAGSVPALASGDIDRMSTSTPTPKRRRMVATPQVVEVEESQQESSSSSTQAFLSD